MKDEDYKLIEAYLEGSLQGLPLSAFEARLADEPDLREELSTHQMMNHYLDTKEKRSDFKQNIQSISGDFFETEATKKEKTRVIPIRWMSIAAGLAILITSFWLLSQETGNLYDQHLTTYQLSSLTERGDNQLNIQSLQNAFNEQRFAEAIPLLETYLIEKPNDLNGHLALGVAQLHTNDLTNAQANLTKVHTSKGILTYDAAWYLALLAIKDKSPSQAKSLLLSIPQGAKYFDRAQELLKEI